MSPHRIGTVPFLNERPLTLALEGRRDVELHRDLPARLAERLRDGALDAALLPVAEILREGHPPLVPFGIACEGEVRSVRLWHEKPLPECREILVQSGSRSSVLLLRLLLDAWGVKGSYLAPVEVPVLLKRPPGEACLLIGDAALRCLDSGRPSVDLGAAWKTATGLPFVFARWVAAPGRDPKPLAELLTESAEDGLARLDEIALDEAPRRNLGPAMVREYLTKNIRFRIGEREEQGQAEFARRAREKGWLPAG